MNVPEGQTKDGFELHMGTNHLSHFLLFHELADRPLAAPELCARLEISTGLLSMSLAELRTWGVVRCVEVPGDRKEHYEPETNVWRLVARVLLDGRVRPRHASLEDLRKTLAQVEHDATQSREQRDTGDARESRRGRPCARPRCRTCAQEKARRFCGARPRPDAP